MVSGSQRCEFLRVADHPLGTRTTLAVYEDSEREVLGLYRERSGDGFFGDAGALSAGAFSIQRLEGSRCGMVVLWVLNASGSGGGRGTNDFIARRWGNLSW
jgi:hypothetical protein